MISIIPPFSDGHIAVDDDKILGQISSSGKPDPDPPAASIIAAISTAIGRLSE
jgi:hypothetical protein